VTKLFFDCRSDSAALLHERGVRLAGVLDLQVADVALRTDDDEKRLARLSPFFYRGIVQGQPQSYRSYTPRASQQSVHAGLSMSQQESRSHQEPHTDRIKCLSPRCLERVTVRAARRYLYRLSGLAGAVEEHQVYGEETVAAIKAFKTRGRAAVERADWGARPMAPELLEYAAMDARLIWDLHAALEGRLRSEGRETAVRQASRR
jgi:hypothetical protein